MILLLGLILVAAGVAVVFGGAAFSGAELPMGFQQLIHARIPWLLLGLLWTGSGLTLYSLITKHRWSKYLAVVPALAVTGLLSWYFLGVSWLPDYEAKYTVGAPFPSYSLPDQNGDTHTVLASTPRRPALYIFYRGDW